LDLAEMMPPGHLSRIDLQVTVPLETEVDLSSIYRVLSDPNKFPWKQTGIAPLVQYFQNTEGGETVYIGKRTSDLLTRIYRKRIEGTDCLRWELEIKGRLARGLQEQNVLADQHVRATFARAVLAGYPDAVQNSLQMFADHIDEPTGEVCRKRAEATDEATLMWFRRTVVPALKRAMSGKLRNDVLDLLREENYYLASYAEYDRMVKERERRERQKERMYKDLQENGRTR
jgi:DNA relaxase NicK